MSDLKKYVVVASGKMRDVAYQKLSRKVILLDCQKSKLSREELDARLADADALYSAGNIKIDSGLLAKAPRLKVIAQASVGYDNIDIAACAARGVRVGNTPGVLVEAVADCAYALLLESARHFCQAFAFVKEGSWGQHKPFGLTHDLAGKTLGIIGMGDIGSAVARRAQASKMQVIYHNRHRRGDDQELGVRYAGLDELLGEADYVLLAVTLNPSTQKLINADTLAKMKAGACLINISRGGVVDTDALYEALISERLAFAAMDVTDPEPLPREHKLLSLDNVMITPHLASATRETRDAMSLLTVDNILSALEGKPMPAEVKKL